jgi:prevent-host-death family protein
MRQVKSEEARRTFRGLLDEAERGGVVQILRYDRPVAVLVPAEWYERALGSLGEITHQSPPEGEYVMPCCGLTPFEAPRTDRMTLDPSLVTCRKEGSQP